MQKLKSLFDRDTLLHLRLPFSFFLLPVFCFAISQAFPINWMNTSILFIVLHFFIYPASNIYNSYMDDDKGSIGGLKNPPPATRKMYIVSIIFDGIGLLLSALLGWKMLLLMTGYIFISKAYSWKRIRLKKMAFLGWLTVMLFQGGYTFMMVNMASENDFSGEWFTSKNMLCMLIASLLIGGYYPLTQIYQHEEDRSRGDFTISYRLGINGTFIFTGVLFILACISVWYYFQVYYFQTHFLVFMTSLTPVIIYYLFWFAKSIKNKAKADYLHAMKMTFLSSCCLIICFIALFFLNHR